MFVDRFSGSVGEGSRIRIDDGTDLDGSKILEGFGGEFVLFVKIGSDDEESVVIKAFEGLVEDVGPHRFIVPEVLMTKKSDVGIPDFGEIEETVAAMGDEVGACF